MTKIYYTIFNLLALSVVIYTGVDMFYRIVRSQLRQVNAKEIVMQQTRGVERHKRSRLSDFKAITDRNIFGSLDKASEEIMTEEIEALDPTSLKVALLGTVTGDRQNAFAVIEETGKRKQGLYKVGDSIQNAIVKVILRGKVILRVEDRDEILTMEEAASSRAEKGDMPSKPIERRSTITLNRSDLAGSLEDISKLMSQVRVRPHFKDGEADGLSVTRIRPDSIFSKMGLEDGDIVHRVSGRPIKRPEDVIELYDRLKTASRVSLQITRKDEPKTLNYRFR